MKKIMTLGAVLIAGAAFAVTSSTIVGYNTATVPAGKQIALTVSFENVAGGSIDITNLLSCANHNANASFGSADQIWRWDTTNGRWDQYYYSKYNKRQGTVDGWCTKASEGKSLTTATIPAGETFFYRNGGSAAQTLVLSGAIKAFSAEPSYSIPAGKQQLIGYPWPVAMPIADFAKFQVNPVSNASFGSADQIWRWDTVAGAWKQYYYSKYNKRQGTVDGWCTKESGGTAVTSDSVNPGEGFFFRNGGSATQTISFVYPIPVE